MDKRISNVYVYCKIRIVGRVQCRVLANGDTRWLVFAPDLLLTDPTNRALQAIATDLTKMIDDLQTSLSGGTTSAGTLLRPLAYDCKVRTTFG